MGIRSQENLEEEIKRLAYYTSVIGDDDRVRKVREMISAITFTCTINKALRRRGQIVPFIRKKIARSRKESLCDIAIAVDVMRACYRDHAETIWLFSGDGDFVQLAEEAVHSGKCVYVAALSSGLNDELRYIVDEFIPLDDYFFLTDEEIFAAKAAVAATTAAVTDANAEAQNPQGSQASGA